MNNMGVKRANRIAKVHRSKEVFAHRIQLEGCERRGRDEAKERKKKKRSGSSRRNRSWEKKERNKEAQIRQILHDLR